MSESNNGFSFIWKIKNFSLNFRQKPIYGPGVVAHSLQETVWKLDIYPNSGLYPDYIACYFRRHYKDEGPEQFELDYELAFLGGDGSTLHSEMTRKEVFKRGDKAKTVLCVKTSDVLLVKKELYIPDDTLTVCCRMWNSQESSKQSGRCFAETRFATETKNYVGIIRKFSSTKSSPQNLTLIKSPSKIRFLSSMNLCVSADGKFVLRTILVKPEPLCIYRYKIFVIDAFGNKIKSGQGEFNRGDTHTISLTILKEHLLENKRLYLPNDTLTIECEINFPTGETTTKIDEPEYGFDTQEISLDPIKMNFTSKEHDTEIPTLMDDLSSLFSEGILYDTKLKTATETFPAHTLILSARSSVFKSMFATDMKEKSNKCVNIDDLDADTLRRMLSFVYTDKLDNLEYENAKNLYFAADKYNIVSLKHRCSSIFKQHFMQSNCFDILLLADIHHDIDLKNAVQDYIILNDETVLFSDEWKNLEMNNSLLATEVLRNIYMKCRRK